MKNPFLDYKVDVHSIKLFSSGAWTLENLSILEQILRQIPIRKKIQWDLSAVKDFDSAGVLLFIQYLEKFQKESMVEVLGYSREQMAMYQLLQKSENIIVTPHKVGFFEKIGKYTMDIVGDVKSFTTFIGHLFSAMFMLLRHPRQMRLKEITYHAYESGFSALLIVGLTAFLVGMVVAYQGAVELAKFGADIFIVDTVAISVVRELGPMITAIVIAGRSGSAYTAEIGAMKITEEISAMRTMGFDPYYFLVIPRVFALMISLPLLIFFADMIGIAGGMFAAKAQLGLSLTQFTDRLYEVLEVKHYLLGLLKAPVFAFVIAAIGCYRGFQVSDNTESIGLQTTASVVNAIFMVIAFDALFSVIYTEFGL
jgi:phospholipid/cholesterol/gamma-HCH transport system permease protein